MSIVEVIPLARVILPRKRCVVASTEAGIYDLNFFDQCAAVTSQSGRQLHIMKTFLLPAAMARSGGASGQVPFKFTKLKPTEKNG